MKYEDLKDAEIIEVDGEDWAGLYINGKLYAEGDSLDWDVFFKMLLPQTKTITADPEWVREVGNLPENLEEVKLDE